MAQLLSMGELLIDFTPVGQTEDGRLLLAGQGAEMAVRQEYIRVTDSDEVDVPALSGQPYVFKYDRLPLQGIYGTVRYMRMYFELFYNAQNP